MRWSEFARTGRADAPAEVSGVISLLKTAQPQRGAFVFPRRQPSTDCSYYKVPCQKLSSFSVQTVKRNTRWSALKHHQRTITPCFAWVVAAHCETVKVSLRSSTSVRTARAARERTT